MTAATGAGGASEPPSPAEAPALIARPMPMWLRVALAVFFGLFFAYDVWEVVESLVQLLTLGLGFTAAGWAIMVAALVAPVVLFVVAFVLARQRGILLAIGCYVAGLAVSGALFASLTVLLGAVGGVVLG